MMLFVTLSARCQSSNLESSANPSNHMPASLHTFFSPFHRLCKRKVDTHGSNEVSDKSFELRKEGYLCSLKQTTVASEPDCAGLCIPISACSHFFLPTCCRPDQTTRIRWMLNPRRKGAGPDLGSTRQNHRTGCRAEMTVDDRLIFGRT
jgi:hypothetical protein